MLRQRALCTLGEIPDFLVAVACPSVGDEPLFLGENLLPLLVLALGAALVVGNGLALVRPPRQAKPGELQRAPVARSVTMLVIGLVAAVWALGSLLAG